MKENISLVKKQPKSPVREDQSRVRVATKTGKKHQGESNDHEKKNEIRPSEEFFNQIHHNDMSMIQNFAESHRMWSYKMALFAIIFSLISPEPLHRK